MQDRLLQMNPDLQSSASSIHQENISNKKSSKKKGAADIGSDDSDEEFSKELRENQA